MYKRYALFLIVLFSLLMLQSCMSQPKIRTMLTEEGIQQYFIRPIQFKSDGFSMTFDCTLRVRDGILIEDPYVNYSIVMRKNEYLRDDPLSLFFKAKEVVISLHDIQILYKDIEKNEIRYSGKIKSSDFQVLIHNVATVEIAPPSEDGYGTFIKSKQFADALLQCRAVIK